MEPTSKSSAENTPLSLNITPDLESWQNVKHEEDVNIRTMLTENFRKCIHPDLIVYIHGKQLFCHKIVVKSFSRFFDQIPNEIEVVIIPKEVVTQEAFKIIYQWMLNDNGKVERAHFAEVLNAALYLQIPNLLSQLSSILNSPTHFIEESAFILYQEYAEFRFPTSTDLVNVMLNRIKKFFLIIIASADFLKMSADDVLILFSSNAICPRSEIDILMACIKWVFYDFTTRETFVSKLMDCVRFGLIPEDILNNLKTNPQGIELETFVKYDFVLDFIEKGILIASLKSNYEDEEYSNRINLSNLVTPKERQWIIDEKWLNDPISQDCEPEPSYKNFLIYLNYITHQGKDHCKQFKLVSELDSTN